MSQETLNSDKFDGEKMGPVPEVLGIELVLIKEVGEYLTKLWQEIKKSFKGLLPE